MKQNDEIKAFVRALRNTTTCSAHVLEFSSNLNESVKLKTEQAYLAPDTTPYRVLSAWKDVHQKLLDN